MDIQLRITHHTKPTGDLIRSDFIQEYTRQMPNNTRSSGTTRTQIAYELSHAMVLKPIPEDDTNDILIILHSRLTPE